MRSKRESTGLCGSNAVGHVAFILGLHRDNIGIMEHRMETTIVKRGLY